MDFVRVQQLELIALRHATVGADDADGGCGHRLVVLHAGPPLLPKTTQQVHKVVNV